MKNVGANIVRPETEIVETEIVGEIVETEKPKRTRKASTKMEDVENKAEAKPKKAVTKAKETEEKPKKVAVKAKDSETKSKKVTTKAKKATESSAKKKEEVEEKPKRTRKTSTKKKDV
ncbi:MAG: hypothetical protein FWF46_00660 [Oscillospiraceae bacterium]|nr:hypothetical protein [Oscillospiraceae bacterium]